MDLAQLKGYVKATYNWLIKLYTKVIYTNKKDTIIFLICLAISLTMWLLLSLSEIYTATIKVPINFRNFPEDRVVVSDLPETMEMDVEAAGFSIISYRLFSSFNDVEVDLSALNFGNKIEKFRLPTSFFSNQLAEHLSSQDRLIAVYPDSIAIDFSPKEYKKVPVIVDDSVQLRKQFFLEQKALVSPDSVLLFGPAIFLKSINKVSTVPIVLTDVHESKVVELEIALPNSLKDVSVDVNKVSCYWGVDQLTEKVLRVNVNPILSEEKKGVKFYPDSVDVVFQVGLSNFDKVTPGMFSVVADFRDTLTWKQMRKIRLQLKETPEGVSYTRLRPNAVEYLFKQP